MYILRTRLCLPLQILFTNIPHVSLLKMYVLWTGAWDLLPSSGAAGSRCPLDSVAQQPAHAPGNVDGPTRLNKGEWAGMQQK